FFAMGLGRAGITRLGIGSETYMPLLLRTLLVLLALTCGVATGGISESQVATARAAQVQVDSIAAPAVEDVATQEQVIESAYNLLMDRFVRPLGSAELARAGWDELVKESDGKMVPPGAPPAFDGDRGADLDKLKAALGAYLMHAGAPPDGFVGAHAIVRGMVHVVDEGHTYFLDPQQYQDYQSWSRGENKYVGIGINVSARGRGPRIVEVYEDTPAQRAGLQAGDVLVRINGLDVSGMPLEEMTSLVRGPAGSDLEIVVRRGDDPGLMPF